MGHTNHLFEEKKWEQKTAMEFTDSELKILRLAMDIFSANTKYLTNYVDIPAQEIFDLADRMHKA